MRRVLLVAGLIVAGCGDELFEELPVSAPAPVALSRPQAAPNQPGEPRTRQELLQFLSLNGVQLQPQDLAVISRYLTVRPTGQWSVGPMGNAVLNLQRHFSQSGRLLQPPTLTPQEYTQRAMAFVTRTGVPYYLDVQFYKQRRQVSVAMWDAASREFAVVGLQGELVAYMRRDAMEPGRFVKLPPDMGPGTASVTPTAPSSGAPVRPPQPLFRR